MTHARVSAEFQASPEAVWKLIGNPVRWPEWDVTYQAPTDRNVEEPGRDGFTLLHTVGNRTMLISFDISSLEPGRSFAAEGRGGEGEQIEERFTIDAGGTNATTVTREIVYTLPGQDLGVIAATTYIEATVQRSAEQALARLAHVLGDASKEHATLEPGDVDTRSTDSGPISPEEPYSSNLEEGNRLPQVPLTRAPKRPT
ncbi:MAG TPA: SRPBCC family protein [Thermomicrobiales bacterium]|nr:SRPBCC family protein [Thermomicrobiales bacterium]